MFRPVLNCYEQDDPRLVSMVRDQVLIQPDYGQEYNLSEAGTLDAFYASREVFEEDLALEMEETYLRDKKNGFFIEAGASEGIKMNTFHINGDNDINTPPGESDSHSLLFEARHGWTGLLVEPMDTGLLYRHRKVGTLPVLTV